MENSRIEKPAFVSDYMEGAHPAILQRLYETNLEKSAGYGLDDFSKSARKKIRTACNAENAEIFFLSGGTQTNAIVINAYLRPYQAVISAQSGHINVHEAGAIEAGGHKVIGVDQKDGKLCSEDITNVIRSYYEDENRDHIVMPAMVYISQPTELGTLYSLEELKQISRVCRDNSMALYLDGARLAYALACPENDVSLKDIAGLCDVFYIGGTKCGALFGEALIFPKKGLIPGFFTIIKQHGALLAKGRIAGLQFDTLFTDDLYLKIGIPAIQAANKIKNALIEKEYEIMFNSPTNQLFIAITQEQKNALLEKAELAFWENLPDGRVIMRIATSWATSEADADYLISVL